MLVFPSGTTLQRSDAGFLSKQGALLDAMVRAVDIVIVAAAAYLMHWIRFAQLPLGEFYRVGMICGALLVAVIFPLFGLYRSWRGERLSAETVRLWAAWGASLALFLGLSWAFKNTEDYSRVWLGGWFFLAGAMLTASRIVVRLGLRFIRASGADKRRVVVIGATSVGARLAAATRKNPWMGLEVAGYIATPFDHEAMDGLECLGHVDNFLASPKGFASDQIWIALPMRAESLIRLVLDATAHISTSVRLVPDFFGYELINHQATMLAGIPVITLRGSRVDGHAHLAKEFLDRAFSALLLILISPLMAALAIGVKLSSPGPVFYRQRRVGLDGREFEMLKFRSMPVEVEKGGVVWGNAGSKSVTRFGKFIRSSSLDELPQFLNVLRGELSIVGPRPERPVFVEQFRKDIPGYMHKHLVKGGITGWAQINGLRGDTDLARRIEFDLQYINEWSIWLDLKIILLTPFALLRRTNAV